MEERTALVPATRVEASLPGASAVLCGGRAVRVYLDMCAWKRPYDTPHSERVRLEGLAVAGLLDEAAGGRVTIVSSEALEVENAKNPSWRRRDEVARLLVMHEVVQADDEAFSRAQELEELGLRALDALHVACAERGGCDYFVTTDRRLRKAVAGHRAAVGVDAIDPLQAMRLVEETDE